MNLRTPLSKSTRQNHPCWNCGAMVSMTIMHRVETHEELTEFFGHRFNRGICAACGMLVEAPVRVTVQLDCEDLPIHECVPLPMLEDPEVLDDLLHNTPDGLRRVYSLGELERSIEAHVRLEMRRQGGGVEDSTLFKGHPDS